MFTAYANCFIAIADRPTWGWRIPEAGLRRLLLESESSQAAVRAWLHSEHIGKYLRDHQGLRNSEIGDWLALAITTLDEEARLPDARPLERHADASRNFAHKLDRMPCSRAR